MRSYFIDTCVRFVFITPKSLSFKFVQFYSQLHPYEKLPSKVFERS